MDFGDPDRAAAFREGARRCRGPSSGTCGTRAEAVCSLGAAGSLHGDYKLDMTSDSANFGLFVFAGLDIDDPMLASEMAEMQRRLSVKTGVGGYAR